MIPVHFAKFELEQHGFETPPSIFLAFLLELSLVGKT
jgi:hypothetical protein